jgi:hypothetical protein
MSNSNDFGLLSPTYSQIAASALVKTGVGKLRGIFCSSTTGGTLKLWDNTSAATTVLVNTFTLVASTYYDTADVIFLNGLYATITNTAEITLFYF